MTYVNGRVSSVNDGSHSWNCAYTAAGSLKTVTLPDGSAWNIDLAALYESSWNYAQTPTCSSLGTPSAPTATSGTMRHPSGALGSYTFGVVRRGRNGAPAN